jgi:hypothetical protein
MYPDFPTCQALAQTVFASSGNRLPVGARFLSKITVVIQLAAGE